MSVDSVGPSVIAVDIDEVLCRYAEGFMRWHAASREGGHVDEPLPDVHACFKIACSRDNGEAREAFANDAAFVEIDRVPGALEGLGHLKRLGVRVEAITSRPPSMKQGTLDYLARNYPGLVAETHLANSGEKGDICKRIGAAVMVDDQSRNVKDACKAGVAGVLFDLDGTYTWNQSSKLPENAIRVKTWDAIVAHVLEVLRIDDDAGDDRPTGEASPPETAEQAGPKRRRRDGSEATSADPVRPSDDQMDGGEGVPMLDDGDATPAAWEAATEEGPEPVAMSSICAATSFGNASAASPSLPSTALAPSAGAGPGGVAAAVVVVGGDAAAASPSLPTAPAVAATPQAPAVAAAPAMAAPSQSPPPSATASSGGTATIAASPGAGVVFVAAPGGAASGTVAANSDVPPPSSERRDSASSTSSKEFGPRLQELVPPCRLPTPPDADPSPLAPPEKTPGGCQTPKEAEVDEAIDIGGKRSSEPEGNEYIAMTCLSTILNKSSNRGVPLLTATLEIKRQRVPAAVARSGLASSLLFERNFVRLSEQGFAYWPSAAHYQRCEEPRGSLQPGELSQAAVACAAKVVTLDLCAAAVLPAEKAKRWPAGRRKLVMRARNAEQATQWAEVLLTCATRADAKTVEAQSPPAARKGANANNIIAAYIDGLHDDPPVV